MVSCKQCNTHNSLDSAFCKKCGATIDPAELALATDRLTAMIADGNRLFADGRTEDALMVAETAIASDPTSAPAVSLKGMCLERKGLLAEALECFERVVELQPDSTLDKLKVNDLKNMLAVEKFEANRPPDRRIAILGAAAATVLVIAAGSLFAIANAKSNDNSKLVASNQLTNYKTFEDAPKSDPQVQNPTSQNQNPVNSPGWQDVPLDGNGPRANANDNIRLPRYTGGPLAKPDGGLEGSIGPVTVNVPPGGLLPPVGGGDKNANQANAQANTSDNRIDPQPGPLTNGNEGAHADPEPQKNDPGIIEIEVSKGNNGKTGNSSGESAPTGNGRQALIATARSQMMQGNYSAAAATYERALRAGADQGSTNQRLGQCYAAMGRNGDAVAAYTRAAAAFEKSGNSQGAEASRQAIKVLGG